MMKTDTETHSNPSTTQKPLTVSDEAMDKFFARMQNWTKAVEKAFDADDRRNTR